MTKKHYSSKIINSIFLLAIICLAIFVVPISTITLAESQTASFVTSSTNLDFSYNGNTSTIYTAPTGWTKGMESNATSGVINVDYYNDTFNLDLDDMPSKIQNSDNYMLMINSKAKNDTTPKAQYYTNTSAFELQAYSSYKIRVYTRVTAELNGSTMNSARASIYLTGLEDEHAFKDIDYNQASEWTAFTFYITTGFEKQNVKLELWLGSKPNHTSNGAVFFDNIEVLQISENEINATSTRDEVINLDQSELVENINADFELSTLADWERINEMATNANAEIIDLSDKNSCEAKDIPYVGTDLSKNNSKALVLYTTDDETTYFGYSSKDIDVAMHDIVKISVNAKVADLNGSAYINLVENTIKDMNGEDIDAITPVTQTITISSNSTNAFRNNYSTYTFYIKGRSLYNTSFKLQLCLGTKSNPASGLVAFDNIKIESISYSDYSSITADASNIQVALDSDPDSYLIKNSAFNAVEKTSKQLTYPLTPSNWTHTVSDKNDVVFGVINTNDAVYTSNIDSFKGFANPGNPEGFGSVTTDSNNILLMRNLDKTYQSIKSNDFEISSNSYYKLTFNYNIIETNSETNIFNVYIKDENGQTLYSDQGIARTEGVWKTYTIYINTKAYSNNLNLILSLGQENDNVRGIVYLDNIVLAKDSTMTADKYNQIAQSNNVLDFQEGNFNLVQYDKDGIYTPLRYDASEKDDYSFGGIIDAEDSTDAFEVEKSPNNTSPLNYIMMLQTFDKTTYSLTAKDSLSLTSDSYYKFSVDVKVQGSNLLNANKEDYDETFGAKFALSGLDEQIEGIVDSEWTTYTIYVACTYSVDVKIQFALVSLDNNTSGIAYFDNYTYEVIDSDTYNLAKLNSSDTDRNLFVDETDEDEEDSSTSSANLEYIWYLIPTLILAVALVLALVAYFLKKFRIKKWEKRKINEYDRDKTVHRDVIRAEAEKTRDESVRELKVRIQELENEKAHIEEIHQEQLKNSRGSRAQGISKNTEREFKQYAKLHTAVENRIITLNKQIDNMNTAEYLLSLQHKIMIEKAKKERQAKEQAYKKEKQAKKSK